ncbi:M23 family metallopeptidase [bacterium]|nr:M23 family metallopeptidase [bacterium]
MKILLFLCCLCSLAFGESRLEQLLNQQRQEYSQAVVTSGFYEPRSISRYRSRPGVHSGYDIAMPAGCRARVAWPGRVEAIIPWADGEWGVQVRHQDGTTATYGHIVPLLEVGKEVQVGEAVGLIARDHLDVKMRDGQGNLFDYAGATACYLPAPPSLPSARALAWQRRWRAFSQRPLSWVSPSQLAELSRQGLSLAEVRPGPELEQLRAEYLAIPSQERARLTWTERDQQACQSWKERHQNEFKRFQLGLAAANRVRKLRRISDFWREVLQSSARTVAVDEPVVGRGRAGRAGLFAAEAANGGI